MRFKSYSNCPDGVKGICWRSRKGGILRAWTNPNLLRHIQNLKEFLFSLSHFSTALGYQAYKIRLTPSSMPHLRALNYSRNGINLHKNAE
jgi:hypothetical protein